jgi:hypothetical protein
MMKVIAIVIIFALLFAGWTQLIVGVLGLAALWMLLSPD